MPPIKYSYSAHRSTNRSGVQKVLAPVLRGAALAALAITAYGVLSRPADANIADQTAYIQALETTLGKCLSGGDQTIQIGNELWVCGAANTGIKAE